jgi:hypothetical protein
MYTYCSGLDLGKQADPSALAVVEVDSRIDPQKPQEPVRHYACRHLQRWPLGTPYPEIIAAVGKLFTQTPLENATLVIDATGVGSGIVDMAKDTFRRTNVPCTVRGVLITAGYAVTLAADGWHVAKRELVSSLQALLQGRRLRVARELPEAATLVRELEVFALKITESANETYGALGSGQHDDLVLALMLACWFSEMRGGGFQAPPDVASPYRTLNERLRSGDSSWRARGMWGAAGGMDPLERWKKCCSLDDPHLPAAPPPPPHGFYGEGR